MHEFGVFIDGIDDVSDVGDFIDETERGAQMVADTNFQHGEIAHWDVSKATFENGDRCLHVTFTYKLADQPDVADDQTQSAFFAEVNPVYSMLLPDA